MRRFLDGFRNAFVGLKTVFSEELNFKIELIIAVVVLCVSSKLKLNPNEMLWIFLAIFLVLSAEILNSLVEEMMDFFKVENEKIRKIKDVSAGLVLLTALFTTIVGVLILGKRLFNWGGVVGLTLYMVYILTFLLLSFTKLR